ncbi:MAG TPA: hypothetical protein PK673_07330 [Paludibacteraceae bacterium]|nr:hypothetical protein [Paludibacteraceae bacterium]
MIKEVLRVYDKNAKNANIGNCYFLILPPVEERDDDEIERRLTQISYMQWQNYTSYLLGYADIAPEEEFWSEIANYELRECKINIDRVTVTGRYKLPECLTYDRA